MEDQTSSPELLLFLASTVHDMKNSVSASAARSSRYWLRRRPARAIPATGNWR